MKKIMNLIACFAIALTMVFVPVTAETETNLGGSIKSLQISASKENQSLDIDDTLKLEYVANELNENEVFSGIEMFFDTPYHNTSWMTFPEFDENKCGVWELPIGEYMKYKGTSFHLTHVVVSINNTVTEQVRYDVYSPYTRDELSDKYWYPIEQSVFYNWNVDFTFLVNGGIDDNTSPFISSYAVSQIENTNNVQFNLEIIEDLTGIEFVAFNFKKENAENDWLTVYLDNVDSVTSITKDLSYMLDEGYSEGIYVLQNIECSDRAQNYSNQIAQEYSISLYKREESGTDIPTQDSIIQSVVIDQHEQEYSAQIILEKDYADIRYIELQFAHEDTGNVMYEYIYDYDGYGKASGIFNTDYGTRVIDRSTYQNHPAGKYVINKVIIYDMNWNPKEYATGLGDTYINLDASKNELLSLTEDNTFIQTLYNDTLILEKGTGAGSKQVKLMYIDPVYESKTELTSKEVDLSSIDLNKIQTTTVDVEFECLVAYETYKTFKKQVNVVVVEDTGLGGILNSLEVNGFKNGISIQDKIRAEIETNVEADWVSLSFKYAYNNGQVADVHFGFEDDKIAESRVSSILKYYGDTYKFLMIEANYEIDGNYNSMFYSPYTYEYLSNYPMCVEENALYKIDKDYSFVLKDATPDVTALKIKSYNITQNGCLVKVDMDIEETGSGVEYFDMMFEKESTSEYSEYISLYPGEYKKYGNTISYTFNLNEMNKYSEYSYGTYSLVSLRVSDYAGNWCDLKENLRPYTIELKQEDNALETIELDDLILESFLKENKLYFRVNDGVGYGDMIIYYKDQTGHKNYLSYVSITKDDIDYSRAGMQYIEREIEFTVNKNRTRKLTVSIPVEIVEVVGEITYFAKEWEVCLLYDVYKNLEHEDMFNKYALVTMNDGSQEIVEFVYGGQGGGTSSENVVTVGGLVMYNPKYYDPNETNGYYIANYTYHLIDKYGNLVDFNGEIIVSAKDRAAQYVDALNGMVKLSWKEGTLPSYTEVDVIKENLDALFQSAYVAYDITPNARYENLQPAETQTVTVEVKVPSSLQGKEVEIYHVDDEGNKELVTTTTADEVVTFDVEHFSTYAIVEKTQSTTPSSPENGSNTEDTSTGNENTTTTSPNTGDTSNVAGLLAMLLASAYVLVKTRKA